MGGSDDTNASSVSIYGRISIVVRPISRRIPRTWDLLRLLQWFFCWYIYTTMQSDLGHDDVGHHLDILSTLVL